MLQLSWIKLGRWHHTRTLQPGRSSLLYVFFGLALLIQASVLGPTTEASAQVGRESNQNTVKIVAEPQRVFPGTTTTVTVNISSVKKQPRERLLVYLPESMQLIGTPSCAGDCSQAGLAYPGSNQVTAILQVNGHKSKHTASAELTFTAAVSSNVKPRTHHQISAYLGSPAATDWIEIFIDAPPIPPTPIPASLSLHVSPDGALLGPNGSFTIFAYPYIPFTPGLATEQLAPMPSMVVRAVIPKGLSLGKDSGCFELGSSTPNISPMCVIETSGDESRISFITVDIPAQERRVGIFLHIQNEGLDTRGVNSLSLTFEETSNSIPVNNPSTTMDIVGVDSLDSLGADTADGSVNTLIVSANAACTESSVPQGTELALAEWGGSPILSTSTARNLTNMGSIASFDDQCPMLISFKNVAPHTLYLLGLPPGPGMDGVFCRACVLGTLPWSNNAIPIIKT